jgi:hypothetical protein
LSYTIGNTVSREPQPMMPKVWLCGGGKFCVNDLSSCIMYGFVGCLSESYHTGAGCFQNLRTGTGE